MPDNPEASFAKSNAQSHRRQAQIGGLGSPGVLTYAEHETVEMGPYPSL
jgi:hypothetical protein